MSRPRCCGRHKSWWDEPSALPEFRVSGLAGHVGTATVLLVAAALDTPVPDQEPVDAVRYFAGAITPGLPLDAPTSLRIRGIAEQAAVDGPAELADRVDATLAGLRATLPDEPADRLVFATRAVLPLDQWLLTRLIELAVHIDDLAVSVGLPTPELPDETSDLVITTLVRIATAHHGTLPVLRTLSRSERAVPISAF